jgi:hypothetical protein
MRGVLKALALGAVALAVLTTAPPAEAAIYWETGAGIGRANLDGTNAQRGFIPIGPSAGSYLLCGGVAVDDSHIYWANSRNNAVGRANLDGTNPSYNFISTATETCGVAVSSSHVYWTNTGGTTLGRAKLDGTEVAQGFIDGASRPCGIAVDAAHVFWGNITANWIGRADLDGNGANPEFLNQPNGGCGFAVAGDHLYWADLAHSIGRANLDGSEADYEFIDGLDRPCGIAIEGGHIFWTEQNVGNTGQVGRANLDGSGVIRNLVPEVPSPCGIAADERLVPPPAPQPPPLRYAYLGRVKHAKRKPVTFVALRVPQAGSINALVSVPGIGWSLTSGSAAVPHGGRWWLRLAPRGAKPAGQRFLRRLTRKNRVAVGLIVEYTTDGRTTSTLHKAVSLRRPSAPRG